MNTSYRSVLGSILVLLSAGQALAQQAATPAAPATASAQNDELFCSDLHIFCQGAFREDMPLLQTLAHTDPRLFLPPALAEFVLGCANARASGDATALAQCASARPLGQLRTLVLIPPSRLREARLPASGARAVHDCTGVHLQLRSDLPLAQELALIRRSFEQVSQDHFGRMLSAIGEIGGPRWAGQTDVAFCPVGGARAPSRMSHMEWRDVGGGYGNGWEMGEPFPSSYVTQRCFAPAPPRAPGAVAQTDVSQGNGSSPQSSPSQGSQGSPSTPGGQPSVPAVAGPDAATVNHLMELKHDMVDACATNVHDPACLVARDTLDQAVTAAYPDQGSAQGNGGGKIPAGGNGNSNADDDNGDDSDNGGNGAPPPQKQPTPGSDTPSSSTGGPRK